MNELGELFLRAALQVTLLGLVAGGLYGWSARRGPAPAARVAALALGLCLVVTCLALCPLPSWWSWETPPSPAVSTATEPPLPPEPAVAAAAESLASSDSVATGWSPADLWQAFKGILPQATAGKPDSRWRAYLGEAVSVGAGLSLLRLLVGLGAVSVCRRRARAIEDVGLREEVDSLRAALGCRRPIELRESADLQTPATLGWLRPVVLLPAGWRGWNAGERQAALAHELAHIARSDYLGALVARLSAALHFYHPVVYWLAGRLRLQQELAADASAARVVGGRGCYLLALARLALRQDGRPPRWPAASFLFSHGTLLKRIAMLRAEESTGRQRLPRLAHLVTVGLLLAAGVLASSLRSPTLTAAPGAGLETPAPAQRSTSVPAYAPFDLSYIPPDARGVGALRPAALFDRPGMKKYVPMVNGIATAVLLERFSGVCFLQVLLGKKQLRLSIVDVEQIVSRWSLLYDAKAPAGQRRELRFGFGGMVRTVKDFDWHKQFRDLFPDMVQTHHAGVTYYRIPKPVEFAGPKLCALFPDARTVVLMPETDIRRWIDHGKEWKTARAWGSAWQQVERDLVAFYARTDGLPLSDPDGDDPTTIALIQAAERISIGIADCDTLKVRGWIECRSRQAGEKWEQAIRGWAKQYAAAGKEKKSLGQQQTQPKETTLEEELLSVMQVACQGAQVTVRSELPKSFADLVKQMDAPSSRPNHAGK